MENDVLRFNPTIATTCYGMNDHRYQPYKSEFGRTYRENSQAIIRLFKEHSVRVIQGSPGTIGRMPPWLKQPIGTLNEMNLSLLELRNIDVKLALEEQVAFADVFVPMLIAGFHARKKYGPDYMVSGRDGVHPGWAGQLVMAYAFLKAMGLDGHRQVPAPYETHHGCKNSGYRSPQEYCSIAQAPNGRPGIVDHPHPRLHQPLPIRWSNFCSISQQVIHYSGSFWITAYFGQFLQREKAL